MSENTEIRKQFFELRSQVKSKAENYDGIIPVNSKLILEEYELGANTFDSCNIAQMAENFCWRRTDQNVFTGYANDGKTLFTLFLMAVKALTSDWRFVLWSPEMRSATYMQNEVVVHYNALVLEFVWMMTKKTPYKSVHRRWGTKLATVEEVAHWVDWTKDHFIFLDPKEKTPERIYDLLKDLYDDIGYDAVLIDPFKNVHQVINMRDDIYLDRLFDTFKDLAIRTNTVMNWIAHPKSNIERVRIKDGNRIRMPCDQHMLAGGAAWENNMDGIYSIFRPNLLENIRDKSVTFFNLKQRRQELTVLRGAVEGIQFEPSQRRYYFDGHDPLNF
jgi:hypothetical protein